MPRRTRRSDEPSAAAQPDVDGDVSPPVDIPVDPSITELPVVRKIRTPPVRRRSVAKIIAQDNIEEPATEEPTAVEPEPPTTRLRIRRPPRSSSAPIETPTEVQEPTVEVLSSLFDDPFAESDDSIVSPVEVENESEPSPAEVPGRVNRRRVGGRRTPIEAAAAVSGELVQPSEVKAEDEAAPRPSRNRRRRGGNRPAEQIAEATALTEEILSLEVEPRLVELPIAAELAAVEVPATDEEQRRSRRSRRGGRRRSGRATEAEKTTEDDVELVEEAVEDDDPLVPLFKPTQVWKAPALVPHPSSLGLSPIDSRVVASLSEDKSGFVVNGQYYGPELFFVNADTADDGAVVASEIALAASIGLHIHSGVAYLPLKNAYGNRSNASIDTLINTVLTADPDGYIVVRLQLVPTNFWARTHPDQMAKFSDGSDGDVSFASREFWQDAVDAISYLISYLADPSTVGGDRVIGLHLDKGEWFNDANAGYDLGLPNKSSFQSWLHEKYQNVYALRAAWFSGNALFETVEIPKWPGVPNTRQREEVVLYNQPRERRFVDYNLYTSDLMAQAITGVAQAVKWLSNGNLIVGTSYGYTFEFSARNDSGHQSLGKILNSSDIDIIAGPNSYATRGAGAAGGFGSPVDSARLHGKLWLIEDDTKTFLAADETGDSFNPKVPNSNDTISVLRRNAAAASVHGCGIIWMDLWGKGWLNSPEIWSEIAELRSNAVISRRIRFAERATSPEVAVIVDEASYAYIRGEGSGVALQTTLINKSRELIYRSGASTAFYLQSDVALLPDSIKLYIFLNAIRVTTSERQAIREKLQTQGKTLVWIYGPGVFDERGESPAEVTEIVGMPLKAQPWTSHIGTIFSEERHPITERLHGGKRLGTDDVLNPSYAVVDPAAIVLGEYVQTGAPSIASKIVEGGWKSVFIGEPHLTGELLRGLYRFAGIHVYDAQDDIVHAVADGLLLVHSPYTGQRTVHLPKPGAVYSLYEHRLITQQSSTFRAFMRGRSTNYFLFGDIERIATVLGTTSDALREQQAAWKAERDSSQHRNQRIGDPARDGISDGSRAEADYATSDEQEVPNDGDGLPEDSGYILPTLSISSGIAEVDILVQNGLIADGSALLDDSNIGAGDTDDDSEAQTPTPRLNEPMSPSRRRRWNRKRNMQAAKEPGPPSISMEDLLSDLPPRKSSQPKSEEQ